MSIKPVRRLLNQELMKVCYCILAKINYHGLKLCPGLFSSEELEDYWHYLHLDDLLDLLAVPPNMHIIGVTVTNINVQL